MTAPDERAASARIEAAAGCGCAFLPELLTRVARRPSATD